MSVSNQLTTNENHVKLETITATDFSTGSFTGTVKQEPVTTIDINTSVKTLESRTIKDTTLTNIEGTNNYTDSFGQTEVYTKRNIITTVSEVSNGFVVSESNQFIGDKIIEGSELSANDLLSIDQQYNIIDKVPVRKPLVVDSGLSKIGYFDIWGNEYEDPYYDVITNTYFVIKDVNKKVNKKDDSEPESAGIKGALVTGETPVIGGALSEDLRPIIDTETDETSEETEEVEEYKRPDIFRLRKSLEKSSYYVYLFTNTLNNITTYNKYVGEVQYIDGVPYGNNIPKFSNLIEEEEIDSNSIEISTYTTSVKRGDRNIILEEINVPYTTINSYAGYLYINSTGEFKLPTYNSYSFDLSYGIVYCNNKNIDLTTFHTHLSGMIQKYSLYSHLSILSKSIEKIDGKEIESLVIKPITLYVPTYIWTGNDKTEYKPYELIKQTSEEKISFSYSDNTLTVKLNDDKPLFTYNVSYLYIDENKKFENKTDEDNYYKKLNSINYKKINNVYFIEKTLDRYKIYFTVNQKKLDENYNYYEDTNSEFNTDDISKNIINLFVQTPYESYFKKLTFNVYKEDDEEVGYIEDFLWEKSLYQLNEVNSELCDMPYRDYIADMTSRYELTYIVSYSTTASIRYDNNYSTIDYITDRLFEHESTIITYSYWNPETASYIKYTNPYILNRNGYIYGTNYDKGFEEGQNDDKSYYSYYSSNLEFIDVFKRSQIVDDVSYIKSIDNSIILKNNEETNFTTYSNRPFELRNETQMLWNNKYEFISPEIGYIISEYKLEADPVIPEYKTQLTISTYINDTSTTKQYDFSNLNHLVIEFTNNFSLDHLNICTEPYLYTGLISNSSYNSELNPDIIDERKKLVSNKLVSDDNTNDNSRAVTTLRTFFNTTNSETYYSFEDTLLYNFTVKEIDIDEEAEKFKFFAKNHGLTDEDIKDIEESSYAAQYVKINSEDLTRFKFKDNIYEKYYDNDGKEKYKIIDDQEKYFNELDENDKKKNNSFYINYLTYTWTLNKNTKTLSGVLNAATIKTANDSIIVDEVSVTDGFWKRNYDKEIIPFKTITYTYSSNSLDISNAYIVPTTKNEKLGFKHNNKITYNQLVDIFKEEYKYFTTNSYNIEEIFEENDYQKIIQQDSETQFGVRQDISKELKKYIWENKKLTFYSGAIKREIIFKNIANGFPEWVNEKTSYETALDSIKGIQPTIEIGDSYFINSYLFFSYDRTNFCVWTNEQTYVTELVPLTKRLFVTKEQQLEEVVLQEENDEPIVAQIDTPFGIVNGKSVEVTDTIYVPETYITVSSIDPITYELTNERKVLTEAYYSYTYQINDIPFITASYIFNIDDGIKIQGLDTIVNLLSGSINSGSDLINIPNNSYSYNATLQALTNQNNNNKELLSYINKLNDSIVYVNSAIDRGTNNISDSISDFGYNYSYISNGITTISKRIDNLGTITTNSNKTNTSNIINAQKSMVNKLVTSIDKQTTTFSKLMTVGLFANGSYSYLSADVLDNIFSDLSTTTIPQSWQEIEKIGYKYTYEAVVNSYKAVSYKHTKVIGRDLRNQTYVTRTGIYNYENPSKISSSYYTNFESDVTPIERVGLHLNKETHKVTKNGYVYKVDEYTYQNVADILADLHISNRLPNRKEFIVDVSKRLYINSDFIFSYISPSEYAIKAIRRADILWNELVKADIVEPEEKKEYNIEIPDEKKLWFRDKLILDKFKDNFGIEVELDDNQLIAADNVFQSFIDREKRLGQAIIAVDEDSKIASNLREVNDKNSLISYITGIPTKLVNTKVIADVNTVLATTSLANAPILKTKI